MAIIELTVNDDEQFAAESYGTSPVSVVDGESHLARRILLLHRPLSKGKPSRSDTNGRGSPRLSHNPTSKWTKQGPLPMSSKAERTVNPIRAIVDPILEHHEKSRGDGKDFISLAVSTQQQERVMHSHGGPCSHSDYIMHSWEILPSPESCQLALLWLRR
jgi:hypothetical protein